MTKDKNKVIEFKSPESEEEKFPEELVEQVEKLLENCKKGKVANLILHCLWYPEEEDEDIGGTTIFWNENNNIKELVADTDMLHSILMDALFSGAPEGE